MKRRLILTTVLSAFALVGIANAQTGSGTLGVSANLSGSINLTFVTDASGKALTGTGTSTASLAFGADRAYPISTALMMYTYRWNGSGLYRLATTQKLVTYNSETLNPQKCTIDEPCVQ